VQGIRGRVIHIHNPGVTVVGTTTDEACLIGRHIAVFNVSESGNREGIELRESLRRWV
jgi:uncharacterized protein (UPF0261 family)